jgi:hypothetical protein
MLFAFSIILRSQICSYGKREKDCFIYTILNVNIFFKLSLLLNFF